MTGNVRKAIFTPRSALPASAACVVANAIRETLASLFGAPTEIRVFEAAIPTASSWAAITRESLLYRVRGNMADAAIVVRSSDALALVAGLFGEPSCAQSARLLSPVELDVLMRTVTAIAVHLGSVCGSREGQAVERVESIEGFSTYFELALEEPVRARIGIALSRDPSPEPSARVELRHLAAIPLTARARLDLGKLSSRTVAQFRPGALVALRAGQLQRCTLSVGGRVVARGSCGISNGHCALRIEALREPA